MVVGISHTVVETNFGHTVPSENLKIMLFFQVRYMLICAACIRVFWITSSKTGGTSNVACEIHVCEAQQRSGQISNQKSLFILVALQQKIFFFLLKADTSFVSAQNFLAWQMQFTCFFVCFESILLCRLPQTEQYCIFLFIHSQQK